MIEPLKDEFRNCLPIVFSDCISVGYIEQGQTTGKRIVALVVASAAENGQVRNKVISAAFFEFVEEIVGPGEKLLQFETVTKDGPERLANGRLGDGDQWVAYAGGVCCKRCPIEVIQNELRPGAGC